MNNLTRIYAESPMLQALVSTTVIYGGLAEGVSGSELREWLVSESEPDGRANGTLESTTAAAGARIAELTRQRDAVIDAYERLLTHDLREVENGYMKLPVDRNGEAWRIGDKFAFAGADGRKHICTVSGVSDCEVFFYYDEHSSSTKHRHFTARAIAHVKPRTIEDVLDEFLHTAADACAETNCELEEQIAKYATVLRGMMEVDDD